MPQIDRQNRQRALLACLSRARRAEQIARLREHLEARRAG